MWIMLIATGDPAVTHIEWLPSKSHMHQAAEHYISRGRDILVIESQDLYTY